MYVPGHLEETDKVLIDIGVGYYVEKVSDREVTTYIFANLF